MPNTDLSRDVKTFGKRQPISVRLGVEEIADIREAAAITDTPITRWMREAILLRLNKANDHTANYWEDYDRETYADDV